MENSVNTEQAETNENDLRSQIADADEQAFYRLFKIYAPLIRPFARRITTSAAAAEDIIQETFIRVWLNRDQLTEIQNLRSWIFTIAAHEAMRYMRKQITHERKTEEWEYLRQQPHETSPLDFVQLNEISRIVQRVVDAMPPQRRLIYQMSRNQGLKPAIIAEQLSLSVGTVKNVLSKALKEIREGLQQSGIALGILLYCLKKFF